MAFVSEQKSNPFAVTVTDFKMENLNGIEMINQTFAQKLHCPFILLSGHVDHQLLKKLVSHGAEVILLEKPPDLKQLEQMIEKVLSGRKHSA